MKRTRAMKPIAEELHELMDERGWSQTDVFAAGGPKPPTITRYLNGSRGRVADQRVLRTLRKFEKAFKLPEGYFLEEQLLLAGEELRGLISEGHIRLTQLEPLLESGREARRRANQGNGAGH